MPSLRQQSSQYQYTRSSTTRRPAIIYEYDGHDGGKGVWDDEEESTTSFSSTTNSLVESVSSKLDRQFLLRVACAFAPPPHNNLHPKDALGATLVDVNPTTGVKIAVSVCVGGDSAGVAQILIPVYFPNPCYDESDTCILENFQTLDEQAQDTIANMEWNDQYADQLAAQQLILQELREEPLGVDLPNWWTFTDLNKGMEEECSLMKDLLNEDDFAADISALFQYRHRQETIQVIKTCVASVGPSGLYLRAYVERTGDYDEDRLDKYVTAPFAVEFDQKATSTEELRSSVFDMVESEGEEHAEKISEVDDDLLPEVPSESLLEDIAKRAYIFQRNLFEARLQMEQATTNKSKDIEQYAFQRNLLGARRHDRAASLKPQKKKQEAFQRKLLEARILYARKNKDTSSVGPFTEIAKEMGQPRSLEELTRLADKHAQIEDVRERAFAILKDFSTV